MGAALIFEGMMDNNFINNLLGIYTGGVTNVMGDLYTVLYAGAGILVTLGAISILSQAFISYKQKQDDERVINESPDKWYEQEVMRRGKRRLREAMDRRGY